MLPIIQLLVLSLLFTACSKKESTVTTSTTITQREESKQESSTVVVKTETPPVLQEPISVTVAELKAYNPQSIFTKKLLECAYPDTEEKSCIVKDLPLLGMSSQKISVSDILNRTLVTHQFLGDSFKQVLQKLPVESLALFGAINGIVLSSEVKTNAYWARSGFIYLNAQLLCRSVKECDFLKSGKENEVNSPFKNLQFSFVNDYVYNHKSIWQNANEEQFVFYKVAATLFHELSHANDYFEPAYIKSSDFAPEKSYDELTYERITIRQMISQRLPSRPKSIKLEHIANVIYNDEEITADDVAMTPQLAVVEFLSESTNDLYAHVNHEEDLARLTEEALMLTFFNIPRLIVFTDTANEIVYAEKMRVAQSGLRPRVLFAIEKSLSKSVAEKVKDKLEATKPLVFPAKTVWDELYL